MSSRMKKISTLLEAIEEMKRIIVITENNEKMPYVIKTRKLEEMQVHLRHAQNYTLQLMDEELRDGPDGNGGSEHDGDGSHD